MQNAAEDGQMLRWVMWICLWRGISETLLSPWLLSWPQGFHFWRGLRNRRHLTWHPEPLTSSRKAFLWVGYCLLCNSLLPVSLPTVHQPSASVGSACPSSDLLLVLVSVFFFDVFGFNLVQCNWRVNPVFQVHKQSGNLRKVAVP